MYGVWYKFDKNNILFPDGTRLLIRRRGSTYWEPVVYNEICECFDTEDGDDFYCGFDDVTEFFLVP